MSYFNIDIDGDVNYLLDELGHNCRINNIPAKAIINNTSMERTNDDKRIITKHELKRGDYIEYNDLYFILLNEINDKRYLSYYKAIMRNCNYNIKIVLDGKLYLFYSIIESDKFNINEGKYITTLADTITITIPDAEIVSLIKENNRIVKFNKVWEVKGIDYTRKGLVQLRLQVAQYDSNKDDLEREIGNYDKLDNPNQDPILPFDEVVEPTVDIISVESFADIGVDYATDINDIVLPSKVAVTLDDDTSEELSIIWNTSAYNGNVAGTYRFEGAIELVEGVINTKNIQATINIIVAEEEIIEEGIIITLTGDSEVGSITEGHYVATVKENGNPVDKAVTFTLSNSLAMIVSQGNNECTVKGNRDFKTGNVTLKATLVEDETIFAELGIYVIAF